MPHVPPHPPKPPVVRRPPARRLAVISAPRPSAVAVVITSVEGPPGFAFSGSGVPDDGTGRREDLKRAEAAAAKLRTALLETPILSLTAAEGVPSAAETRATFLYDLRAGEGVPVGDPLRALAFNDQLSVDANRLPSGFVRVRLAFRHTHTIGVAWRALAPPVAEVVTGRLDDTFKSGETVFIAKIPAQSPTGRFYFATVTILPPGKD